MLDGKLGGKFGFIQVAFIYFSGYLSLNPFPCSLTSYGIERGKLK